MKQMQTLKGFRDFLPQTALARNWLADAIRRTFELWGYDPIETPTLEPLELFAGQIGEDEKLFFKFKDKGNRDVALRYDQTVPTCRVVGQYFGSLAMPFRRYQIQTAFRAEKPQKGRYREFLQADADIFGVSSPQADAEVIALSLDIYRRIGFSQVKVLINDRVSLKDIPYPALVEIDKLKKLKDESLVVEKMIKKGISADTAWSYLKKVAGLPKTDNIKYIENYLRLNNIPSQWVEFDPTLIRSFSYSTGPIWEIIIPGFEVGSVLGGERYDGLVEKVSGLNVPGTGFGLGFDRTLEAAMQFDLIPMPKTSCQVLVTIFSGEFIEESIKVSAKLRQNNINVELYPDETKSLDKQLKYASKKGIGKVIILGPDEVAAKKVTIKNLETREQQTIGKEDLTDFFTAHGQ